MPSAVIEKLSVYAAAIFLLGGHGLRSLSILTLPSNRRCALPMRAAPAPPRRFGDVLAPGVGCAT